MDWPVVEVVIGLSFMFFLISIIASATNEAIAGIFKLRARSLEQGIKNLLTGSTSPTAAVDVEIVKKLYDHALVNGFQRGTDENEPKHEHEDAYKGGPSYLSSRSFRNALLDITELLEATADPADDPTGVKELREVVEAAIDELPSHLKRTLMTIWRSANKDAAEFREGVERWFDRGMERVSGWYKRRTQVILFVVGFVVAIAINASALTAADRLWKDNGLRKGLVAQAEQQLQSTSGADTEQEQIEGTTALEKLEKLEFPIGWGESTRPNDPGGWLLAVLGWMITGLAVTLGAPFWFDALGKVSNLRAAGSKPASTVPPSTSATEVAEVKLNIASP
jgi:hypothetical protein